MIRSLSDRFRIDRAGRSASERPRSLGMLWGSTSTYGEFDSDYEEKSFDSDDEDSVYTLETVESRISGAKANRERACDDEYSVYTLETVESRVNRAKANRERASAEDRNASQSEAKSQQEQQKQQPQQQQQQQQQPKQPQSESQSKPQPQSTTITVGAKSPLKDLKTGLNDFSKASVKLKDVKVTREVASRLMELLRGDKRTWEEVAVDLLRQNSRWESIVFDSCRSLSSSSTSTKKSDKADKEAKDGDTKSDDLVIVEGDDKTKTDKGKTDSKKNDDGGGTGPVNFLDLVLSSIINLDNCRHIHLTGLEWSATTSFAIQSILFSRYLTKLQLDFIDLSRHVPSLLAGLSGNKSLTCFIASRCGLDDSHLETLLGHLPPGLEELRIFGNKCRSRGLESLADILRNRKAALQVLDISFQHVGPDEKFDMKSFAEALGGNETLRVLDLTNDSLTDEHLVLIIAALCRNTTLEELVLNHNKITGAGVAMMATKYGEIKGLKKISMYSNMFDGAS